MAKLTYQQKLDALAYRFYQGAAWEPKAGDFYTTSRADLELYQVVSVEGGVVRTRYTEGSDSISEWPEAEFLTGGFGPKRVFVPEWIICGGAAEILPNAVEELREAAVMIRTWIPVSFPANEHGQVHFVRAVVEAVADTIERAISPVPTAIGVDHG